MALFLCAGCVTGQTGGEIETQPGQEVDNVASGSFCTDGEKVPLALDDGTKASTAAQAVIDLLSGSHEVGLDWGGGVASVDGGFILLPASGESTITITIIPQRESAVLVQRSLAEPMDGTEIALVGDPSQCGDELRLDAEVTVYTKNGALAETFLATFAFADEHFVSTRIPLAPGEMAGTFDVELEDPNEKPIATNLEIAFAFGSLSGDVSGMLERRDGDVVGGRMVTYARFPKNTCESGQVVISDSEFGQSLMETLSQYEEFVLTWSGETTPTTLTLNPVVEQICLVDGSYVKTRWTSTVETADGRIDGTWLLSAEAEVDSAGALGPMRITRQNEHPLGVAPGEFESETGIGGVQSTAEALDVEFYYQITDAQEPAAGELVIRELTIPACARPGYEPEEAVDPDGGAGSEGCEGVNSSELESAGLVGSASP